MSDRSIKIDAGPHRVVKIKAGEKGQIISQFITVSDGTEIKYCLDDFTDPWIEEKDTVFLNHGMLRNVKFMAPLVAPLARRYRVLRIDERGCGESRMPTGSYKASTERFNEDILNIIDELGIDKIHFFGESSGGIVGISFALAYPERLKSLILCQTPYKVSDEAKTRYHAGDKDLGAAIMKYGLNEAMNRIPGRRSVNPAAGSKVVDWYNTERAKTPVEVAANRYNWYLEVDLSERLAEIKVPTLIISAPGSWQTPLETGIFMEKQIPRAKRVVIEDASNQLISMTAPDLCAQAVLDFLETVDED